MRLKDNSKGYTYVFHEDFIILSKRLDQNGPNSISTDALKDEDYIRRQKLFRRLNLFVAQKSMATKPFHRTKVSISSLDVLGDEIVH